MALASGPRWGQSLDLFSAELRHVKPAKDHRLYKHDTALFHPVDLPAALGLLTRLPIRVSGEKAMSRGAASAWAYPLVGVIVGIMLAVIASLLLDFGIPVSMAAGLVLAASVVVSGAMHEDGLADTADGLWGGWDKARRLEIMKDSHIGVYGVCAIVLALLLRYLAISMVLSMGSHWVVFVAVGAVSRTNMVVLMALLPNARDSGLSQSVGRPSDKTVWIAVAIGAGVAYACGYPGMILVAAVAGAICALIARAKIGGQTGDILGATQQVTTIALLMSV